MTIYVVRSDPDSYDSLLQHLLAPFDDWWPRHGFESWMQIVMALDGRRMAERWKPIPVTRYRRSHRRNAGLAVDFHACDIGRTAISERALQAISPLVGSVVEALPLEIVDHPEQRYYVLHVVDVIDCLDHERTRGRRIAEDAYTEINQYAFRPGTTDGHHLFRVREMPLGPNLASEEFKQLVESHGLVGLKFASTEEPIFLPWEQPRKQPAKSKPKRRTKP
jgi:hypothetical protein